MKVNRSTDIKISHKAIELFNKHIDSNKLSENQLRAIKAFDSQGLQLADTIIDSERFYITIHEGFFILTLMLIRDTFGFVKQPTKVGR